MAVHCFYHNRSDQHIHFTDFIADHSSHWEHYDKDHGNHNKLPLHIHAFNFRQTIFNVALSDFFYLSTSAKLASVMLNARK